jgi:hypothetical protein
MAEALKAAALYAGLLGALLPLAGAAAGLTDPTLPPAPPVATTSVENGAAPERAPARLQMVIRGPGETRVAVIDGVLVHVGDRVSVDGGEARVARITDHAVTLMRGDARQTLELLPTVSARREPSRAARETGAEAASTARAASLARADSPTEAR